MNYDNPYTVKRYTIAKQYNKLCAPSVAFLVLSATSLLLATGFLILLFVQKRNITRRGPFLLMLLMLKVGYVLFWTWILDLICKSGHDEIAWGLVFAPYVLFVFAVILTKLS